MNETVKTPIPAGQVLLHNGEPFDQGRHWYWRELGPSPIDSGTIGYPKMSNRPGLAKARQRSTLRQKTRQFVRAVESSLRGWMDGADVVSEGGMNGDRYFGSTSIFLAWQKAPEGLFYGGDAARALLYDPHLRLRALRLARREAEARATGNISSVSADLRASFDARGMFVTIDVEAALIRGAVWRRRVLHS